MYFFWTNIADYPFEKCHALLRMRFGTFTLLWTNGLCACYDGNPPLEFHAAFDKYIVSKIFP